MTTFQQSSQTQRPLQRVFKIMIPRINGKVVSVTARKTLACPIEGARHKRPFSSRIKPGIDRMHLSFDLTGHARIDLRQHCVNCNLLPAPDKSGQLNLGNSATRVASFRTLPSRPTISSLSPMKTMIHYVAGLGLVVTCLTGCRSIETPPVRSERISQSTESVPAVSAGYDTFGRKWENPGMGVDGIKSMEYVTSANRSPLVRLQKRVPAEVNHGQEYSYDLIVTAADTAHDVIVTDTIPAGASFVRSEPPSSRDAQQLMWRYPSIQKGGAQTIRVWLKADKAGELSGCPTVSAAGLTCLASISGTPQLALHLGIPENAVLDFPIPASLVVSNRGTITARGVNVQYSLPEGLAQAGSEQPVTFSAGDLAPGESKSLNLRLKPAAHARVRSLASATSSNANSVQAEAWTTIAEPKVDVAIKGPAEEFILKDATYQITLRNSGDATLTDVVVSHDAPLRTEISKADGAASARARSATWKIDSFRPGEERVFNVVLSGKSPGKREQQVTVTAAQNIREQVSASTDWKGLAALAIEVADNADPVQVGGETVYTIRVSNQGSADQSDVNVVATLPAQLSAVKVSAGDVQGNTIRFPAVARLAPRQSVKYQITARGASAGDARMRVELRAGELQSPVIEEESTRVY